MSYCYISSTCISDQPNAYELIPGTLCFGLGSHAGGPLVYFFTSILVAMLLHCKIGQHGVEDEKALRKQDRRQTSETDETDRPDWSAPVFCYTPKVSRQVPRFFKHYFQKPASQALYEGQLRLIRSHTRMYSLPA